MGKNYSYSDAPKKYVRDFLDWLIKDANRQAYGGHDQSILLEGKRLQIKNVSLDFLRGSGITEQQVRDSLNYYLTKFLGIAEDKRTDEHKRKGKNYFTFDLSTVGVDLKNFEALWEKKNGERKLSNSKVDDFDILPSKLKISPNISWRDICDRLLKHQGKDRLTTAALAGNLTLEGMHVPLGLVKREKKQEFNRPDPNILPEMGSKLYRERDDRERITKVEYEDFREEVLKGEKNIAIIGEPGAGKTTVLQKIAFELLDKKDCVVVWVDLGELGNGNLNSYILEDWLAQAAEVGEVDLKRIGEDFDKRRRAGKVWLLLDGVDEMDIVSNPLSALAKELRKNIWFAKINVVLTCRLNVWDADKNALNDYQVYRNLDFEHDQVEEFIKRWFTESKQSDLIEPLKKELQVDSKARIRDLVRNPLRLTLLCLTYQKGTKLPDTKAGLFERFVGGYYDWKDRDISEHFDISFARRNELHQELGNLAKAAIAADSSRFRLRESFVKQYLGDRKDPNSLFFVACKFGWLNLVGLVTTSESNSDENVYAFFHPTFQEYFAACAIADWRFFFPPSPLDVEGDYPIFDARWREVILLWFGRGDMESEKKESFIEALIDTEYFYFCNSFYSDRAYMLAAICLAEFKECSRGDDIVGNLICWGFGTLNEDGERWAMYSYGLDVRSTLKQSNLELVVNAIRHYLLANSIYEHLQYPVVDEEDRFDVAIWTLQEIDPKNSDAITTLIEIIRNPKIRYSIKLSAALQIVGGKIDPKNADAVSILIEGLQNSKLDFIKKTALVGALVGIGLGEIGKDNSELLLALNQILKKPKGKLSEIFPAITSTFQFKRFDFDTKLLVASALGQIGYSSPEVIDTLTRLINKDKLDKDPRLDALKRFIVAMGLGTINPSNDRAIYFVFNLTQKFPILEDDKAYHQGIREWMAKLIEIDGNVINICLQIIQNPQLDPETKVKITGCLCRIGVNNSDIINRFNQFINNPQSDYEARFMVTLCLYTKFNNPNLIDTFIELIRDPKADDQTRISFISSLIKKLDSVDSFKPNAINVLIQDMNNSKLESLTRLTAAFILGGEVDFGNTDVIDFLTQQMRDQHLHYNERFPAAQLLAQKIDPSNQEAINFLSEYMKAPQFDHTIQLPMAIEIIIGIKIQKEFEAMAMLVEEAVAILIESMQDPQLDYDIRLEIALKLLMEISNPKEFEVIALLVKKMIAILTEFIVNPSRKASWNSNLKDCYSNLKDCYSYNPFDLLMSDPSLNDNDRLRIMMSISILYIEANNSEAIAFLTQLRKSPNLDLINQINLTMILWYLGIVSDTDVLSSTELISTFIHQILPKIDNHNMRTQIEEGFEDLLKNKIPMQDWESIYIHIVKELDRKALEERYEKIYEARKIGDDNYMVEMMSSPPSFNQKLKRQITYWVCQNMPYPTFHKIDSEWDSKKNVSNLTPHK